MIRSRFFGVGISAVLFAVFMTALVVNNHRNEQIAASTRATIGALNR